MDRLPDGASGCRDALRTPHVNDADPNSHRVETHMPIRELTAPPPTRFLYPATTAALLPPCFLPPPFSHTRGGNGFSHCHFSLWCAKMVEVGNTEEGRRRLMPEKETCFLFPGNNRRLPSSVLFASFAHQWVKNDNVRFAKNSRAPTRPPAGPPASGTGAAGGAVDTGIIFFL